MSIIFRIVLLLVLVFSTGCAVSLKTPATRFNSPEAMGKLGLVQVAAGWSGANKVTLSPAINLYAPDPENPAIDREDGGDVVWGLGLGLPQRIDVELRNLKEIFARWQFLGEPRTVAKGGNFSLALVGSLAAGSSEVSATELFGTGQAKNELEHSDLDLGLMAGYRFNRILLVYGGPSLNLVSYKGKYTSTISSLPSKDYSGTIRTPGANLGLEVGNRRIALRVEGSYSQVVAGGSRKDLANVGALLVFRSADTLFGEKGEDEGRDEE